MHQALQSVEALTQQLLEFEKTARPGHYSELQVAINVCAKIQIPLTRFAGPVGYSSLLSRALSVARMQFVRLHDVNISTEGPAKATIEFVGKNFQDSDYEGGEGACLVAKLLELIETFVGRRLLLTLLSEAWPNESFDEAARKVEVKP